MTIEEIKKWIYDRFDQKRRLLYNDERGNKWEFADGSTYECKIVSWRVGEHIITYFINGNEVLRATYKD